MQKSLFCLNISLYGSNRLVNAPPKSLSDSFDILKWLVSLVSSTRFICCYSRVTKSFSLGFSMWSATHESRNHFRWGL